MPPSTCRRAAGYVLALCVTAATTLAAHAEGACPRALTADIPTRTSGMADGSAFARTIATKERTARDDLTTAALLGGNLPAYLRNLQPVALTAYSDDGRELRATLCVMPDYLAVGSDRDHLHMPMALGPAARVAAQFGFVLPTRHMVDAIYAAAPAQLRPQPLPASDTMRSTAYFVRHDAAVRAQFARRGMPLGTLVAGHKKDVVLSTRLDSYPDRVAIYGWHEPNGHPIQSLSTRHGAPYVDYSHGIRLVSDVMLLNGRVTSVHDVLANPHTAMVLSDEGPVTNVARYVPARPRHVACLQAAMLAAQGPGEE